MQNLIDSLIASNDMDVFVDLAVNDTHAKRLTEEYIGKYRFVKQILSTLGLDRATTK